MAIGPAPAAEVAPAPAPVRRLPVRRLPVRRLNVWLVHGTWARGIFAAAPTAESGAKRPIWSDPNSAFHNALAEKLQEEGFHARIIPFLWSGANTVRLRDGVARDLARSIETSTEDGTLNVVIGHSHGGTIALTAAAEYLTTPIDILVATLATPFIDMFPKIDKRSDRYGAALGALHREQLTKLCFVSLLFGLLLCFAIRPFSGENWAYGIAFVVALLFNLFLNTIYGRYGDSLNSVPPPYGSMARIAGVRLLVLRGIDDEAALTIAAGAIQSLITAKLARIFTFLLGIIGLLWYTLLYSLRRFWGVGIDDILVGLAVIAAGYVGISLLQAIGRSVLGREFFFTGQIYDVNVNSVPDLAGDVTIRTLAGQTGEKITPLRAGVQSIKSYTYRRRHSLYEHKDCIDHIVTWISRQTQTG